jgi:hypothetical protein
MDFWKPREEPASRSWRVASLDPAKNALIPQLTEAQAHRIFLFLDELEAFGRGCVAWAAFPAERHANAAAFELRLQELRTFRAELTTLLPADPAASVDATIAGCVDLVKRCPPSELAPLKYLDSELDGLTSGVMCACVDVMQYMAPATPAYLERLMREANGGGSA